MKLFAVTMQLDRALQEILATYPRPARPRNRPQDLGNAGGLSGAKLWRFDSDLGPLVARAWPVEFQDHDRLERIHRWLADASALPFIPMVIAKLDSTTMTHHVGRYWELTSWLCGSADLSVSPSSDHVEAAFRGLAEFHRRLSAEPASRRGPSPGLVRRFREMWNLLHGGFDQLERAIGQSPRGACQELAAQWLELARPIAPSLIELVQVASSQKLRLQPCVRDARRDHFLFEGDRLTGIVDYGAMDVESVAGDLARLIGDWLSNDRDGSLRLRGIGAYESIFPLDVEEKRLLEVFERTTLLLAPSHWIRWHIVEGREFEDPNAVERGLKRGLEQLQQSFRELKFVDSNGLQLRPGQPLRG